MSPYHRGWRPEWVICGVDLGPEGVAVYGCKDVYHGTLEVETEWDLGPLSGLLAAMPSLQRTSVHLSTTASSYTVAYGADYPEALRKLLGAWTPDASSSPIITTLPDAARRQLGGAE